jgi:predicted Zn-dependent protease
LTVRNRIVGIALAVFALDPGPQALAEGPKLHPTHAGAREELPRDWYAVYRVVDRLARANGLDNMPWRVMVVPEYQVNAFASELNLVSVYSGLLDQIAGDSSALACAIGHEMGHHVRRHTASGNSAVEEMRERFAREAEADVRNEAVSAQKDAAKTDVAAAILGRVAGTFGAGGLASPVVGGLRQESGTRISEAKQRTQQIVAIKEAQYNASVLEHFRAQETEADELGYLFSGRADFDADGCLRVLDVLERMPGAEIDSDHPSVPNRRARLQELMAERPAAALRTEGLARISGEAADPLTYDLSLDGRSLRVNPAIGGNAGADIERRFDQ